MIGIAQRLAPLAKRRSPAQAPPPPATPTSIAERLSGLQGRAPTPDGGFAPPLKPTSMGERLAAVQAQITSVQTPGLTVPFGDWLPDLPAFSNPGATVANGVIPKQMSYGPFPGLVAQSGALTARCRGASAARDTAGNTYFYAGDATKLYEIRSQSANDKSGATYTTSTEQGWEFALFGQTFIATNFDDHVQAITAGAASNFADLFTSTQRPKARHVGVVRDFAVFGNINDTIGGDGLKPNRVQWTGINDPTDIDPDATTQSDFQDIGEGGWVQRIVGGVEYGLVFQQRAIVRMTYVGSPLVFDFSPIDRRRGTPIPHSVIAHGRLVYYISEEGFFVTDGSQSYPIGANQVDKTFWDQFDVGNAHRVSAAVDPVNKLISWAFPGTGSTGGNPNKIYLFNYVDKRWSEVDLDVQIITPAETQAYTLEQLDDVTTDIETLTPSMDSPAWQGGLYRFAAFDTSNKLAYFTGDNVAATLETGEFQIAQGRRSQAKKLRPQIDGGTITAAIAGRSRLIDTASYDSAATMDSIGEISVRNDARYHRVRCSIAAAGTWNHAQGVEVLHAPSGER